MTAGIVNDVCETVSGLQSVKETENAEEKELYFGISTGKGLTKFKCKSKADKQTWVDSIRNLLHRVTAVETINTSLETKGCPGWIDTAFSQVSFSGLSPLNTRKKTHKHVTVVSRHKKLIVTKQLRILMYVKRNTLSQLFQLGSETVNENTKFRYYLLAFLLVSTFLLAFVLVSTINMRDLMFLL